MFSRLLSHEGIRKYAANTSWLFFERIIRMGVTLVVGLYVVRYLGPNKFGQLSYAQSFVALFAPLAALGLDAIVVQSLVKAPKQEKVLLGTAVWLKLVGATCAVILMVFVEFFTTNTSLDNLFIVLLGLGLFFQAAGVFDLLFQSVAKSSYVVKVQLVQVFLSAIVKIALVLVGAPLWLFVASYLLDNIILAVGLLLLAKIQEVVGIFSQFEFAIAKQLLKASLPFLFTGLAVAIYMRIDQVMLRAMIGNNAVGQFSAALKLSEAWYFIPLAICNSVFPAIVLAKEKGRELYEKRLQQLYDLMVALSVLVAIPITLFADWIVNFLYGSAYQEAIVILQIHVWTGPFVFLGVAMNSWLIAEGFGKKSLYRSMLGVFVNVLANIWLIPIYGAAGAAVATLLSQVAANLLYDFFDSDVRDQLYIKLRAFLPVRLLTQIIHR